MIKFDVDLSGVDARDPPPDPTDAIAMGVTNASVPVGPIVRRRRDESIAGSESLSARRRILEDAARNRRRYKGHARVDDSTSRAAREKTWCDAGKKEKGDDCGKSDGGDAGAL